MVLHEFNMNMQSIADKRLSVCILMLFLELFFEGKTITDNQIDNSQRSTEMKSILNVILIFFSEKVQKRQSHTEK